MPVDPRKRKKSSSISAPGSATNHTKQEFAQRYSATQAGYRTPLGKRATYPQNRGVVSAPGSASRMTRDEAAKREEAYYKRLSRQKQELPKSKPRPNPFRMKPKRYS